jgi:hypothetical protein
MVPFDMNVRCKWCNESIEIDPNPTYFDAITMQWVVDSERQKEIIERHTGWIAGMDAFCSEDCKSDYTDEKNIEDYDEGES